MIELTLPWPPKALNPNTRVHWSVKSKAAKAYRAECAWTVKGQQLDAALKAGRHVEPLLEGQLHLFLDFYPPNRSRRDDDNLVAAFKSGRDGIADALGIKDYRFICHPFIKDEIGGFVKVRITAGPENASIRILPVGGCEVTA